MKKRVLAILLVLVMILTTACTAKPAQTETTAPAPATEDKTEVAETAAEEAAEDFKIGVVYLDASSTEEPTRAFEALKAKYGDMVVGTAYNWYEPEAIMTAALSLISDPSVKALTFFQEAPGTAAAANACREIRPDVLYSTCIISEDLDVVEDAFDVILDVDKNQMGEDMVKLAHELGAKTLVHYTIPQLLAVESLVNRTNIMEAKCKELGINFIAETAPELASDGGATNTQLFVAEDVVKKVEQYGKDTAFFGTTPPIMDPLSQKVAETGAIMTSVNDPTPYGYASGLSVQIPADKANNVQYAMEAIEDRLAELGTGARLGTWPLSSATLYFHALFEYSKAYIEGEFTERTDLDALAKITDQVADELSGQDASVTLKPWENAGKTYEHLVGVSMDYIALK